MATTAKRETALGSANAANGTSAESDITTAYAFCAIAILGLCALIWALGSVSGRQAEQALAEPHLHALAARDRAIRECGAVAAEARFDCLYARIEAGGAAARGDQDLVAQQRLARAAVYVAIAALALAAIGAAALWYLRQTLAAWRHAVGETRRIGEAQVRCYLGVARVVVDFNDHHVPVVSCKIVNSGQSPALAMRWQAALTYDVAADAEPRASGFHHAAEGAGGITIPANDSAIPADIEMPHDLADGLKRIADGADILLLCTVRIAARDVFGHPVEQAESFVAKLDARVFANPVVSLEPYAGALTA